MTDLIQRIEAAKEPSADLFEDAFVAIHGPKPPRVHGGSQEWLDWLHLHNPFARMLDAQAWTSAAEMLVPEGWYICSLSSDLETETWLAIIAPKHNANGRASGNDTPSAHPGLALLSAIMRAERKDDE